MRRFSINQYEARVLWFKNPISVILVHLVPDASDDLLVPFGIPQIHFRKDQIQCGRRILHDVLDCFPVLRLGSVLITSDDTPLGEVQALPWEQNPRNLQAQIREAQVVRTAEHFMARGTNANARELCRATCQVQDVPEKNGEGNVTHPTRHWRDLRGDAHGFLEANIPHDASFASLWHYLANGVISKI